jgi:hypothetical protein
MFMSIFFVLPQHLLLMLMRISRRIGRVAAFVVGFDRWSNK